MYCVHCWRTRLGDTRGEEGSRGARVGPLKAAWGRHEGGPRMAAEVKRKRGWEDMCVLVLGGAWHTWLCNSEAVEILCIYVAPIVHTALGSWDPELPRGVASKARGKLMMWWSARQLYPRAGWLCWRQDDSPYDSR